MNDEKNLNVDANNENKTATDDQPKTDPATKTEDPEKDKKDEEKGKDPEKLVSLAALHEEREKRKQATSELEAIKAKQKEDEEKKLAENGEFQKLHEDAKTENSTLKQQLEESQSKLKAYEDSLISRIDEQIESIELEADKTFVKEVLGGKSLAEKEKLLPSLLSRFSKADDKNPSIGTGNSPRNTGAEKQEAIEKAKKEGDVMALLKNAPRS